MIITSLSQDWRTDVNEDSKQRGEREEMSQIIKRQQKESAGRKAAVRFKSEQTLTRQDSECVFVSSVCACISLSHRSKPLASGLGLQTRKEWIEERGKQRQKPVSDRRREGLDSRFWR